MRRKILVSNCDLHSGIRKSHNRSNAALGNIILNVPIEDLIVKVTVS